MYCRGKNLPTFAYSFRQKTRNYLKIFLFQLKCSSTTSAEPENYAATLLLPKTTFTTYPNLKDELEFFELHQDSLIYKPQLNMKDRPPFVLLDGPPFANGSLHIGHFLNKVLKDILLRYKMLMGFSVRMIPGWDTHGLPVEMKVLQELAEPGKKDSNGDAIKSDPLKIRKLASELADRYIALQKRQFKKWGILADWDNYYETKNPIFEANELRIFGKMVEKGLIYQALRPVYWSPSTGTALAEAELEYRDDHKSLTLYYCYPLIERDGSIFLNSLNEELKIKGQNPLKFKSVQLAIWTSTIWTIPSNRAVAVHARHQYTLLDDVDRYLVVHQDLAGNLRSIVSAANGPASSPVEHLGEFAFLGNRLVGLQYEDPIFGNPESSNELFTENKNILSTTGTREILHGDFVDGTTGTGLVHISPDHGMDDYILFQSHLNKQCDSDLRMQDSLSKVPILLSLVDELGRFTQESPAFLRGLSILDPKTLDIIVSALSSNKYSKFTNLVLRSVPLTHSYPYDWRSKKPVIVRTTPQWFVGLSGDLKKNMVGLLQSENSQLLIHEQDRERLKSMLQGRLEWCISRQRAWGLPLPIFYDTRKNFTNEDTPVITDNSFKENGIPLCTEETVDHVAKLFIANGGSDAWWRFPIKELMPPSFSEDWIHYRRGLDTLDVWFDSGSAWSVFSTNLFDKPNNPTIGDIEPMIADVVLEGGDQFRGWFQSMVITSTACNQRLPFKQLISHGFVLDEQGRKMSKSLGNVVNPDDLICKNRSDFLSTAEDSSKCGRYDSSPSLLHSKILSLSSKDKYKGQGNTSLNTSSPKFPSKSECKDIDYGIETLRLWIASADWRNDVRVGPAILARVLEIRHKIRNTFRFLVGNLARMAATTDSIELTLPLQILSVDRLRGIDRWLLHRLLLFQCRVQNAYADGLALRDVVALTNNFCTHELSSIYFDISKDALYADPVNSFRRRCIISTLVFVARSLLATLSPILPYTTHQVFTLLPAEVRPLNVTTPLHAGWPVLPTGEIINSFCTTSGLAFSNGTVSLPPYVWDAWITFKQSIFDKALDAAKKASLLSKSTQVHLFLCFDQSESDLNSSWSSCLSASVCNSSDFQSRITSRIFPKNGHCVATLSFIPPMQELADFFIVSQVSVLFSGEGVYRSSLENIHILAEERALLELCPDFNDTPNLKTNDRFKIPLRMILTHSKFSKCPRCWLHAISTPSSAAIDDSVTLIRPTFEAKPSLNDRRTILCPRCLEATA